MSVKSKLDRVVERANSVRTKGPKTMWYAVAIDTLLDMFLASDTVSRDDLKAELSRRMEKYADHELLRGSYDEAIAQLTDPISPSTE